ncbi:LytR C-terminal domain-containing protein [Streptomyces fuscigenes]|nr:LytR C-terminal domain-containing protein [Streptomyces fuscigenes]
MVGYDEYGRPVYEQQAAAQGPTQDTGEQGYGGGYDTGQQPPVGGYDTGQQPPVGGYDTGQQPPVGGYDTGRQPPVGDRGQGWGTAQGYGYDPYGRPPAEAPQAPQGQGPAGYDAYGHQGGRGPDAAQAYGWDTGPQPAATDTTQQWNIPQQQAPQHPRQAQPQQQAPGEQPGRPPHSPRQPGPAQQEPRPPRGPAVPGQRSSSEEGYHTEQFAFIEEPDEDSEDVIDWLAFTESRTERREEARRRGRNRVVALLVVLAVAVVGGAGYLWYAGKLPGLDAPTKKQAAAASGPQKRDVIVVHLHDTADKSTSTALLVNNETTGQGSTVLLPGTLNVTNDDGTVTTLAKSVEEDGSDGTRESIGNLLGTKVAGTWRLDTPYLENLVDLVGNVEVDTDTDVPDAKKGAAPLVHRGKDQTLSGKMAVAYATYHAPGESDDKQLDRFGQVVQATLRKLSSDPKAATVTVQTLAQILDPSLTDKDLGAALAKLAAQAKADHYKTFVLPVGKDGTLSGAGEDEVKKVLGGSVSAPDPDGIPRVGVKNATGGKAATEAARVALVNGGYTVVDTGTGAQSAKSTVTYADAKNKEQAGEVAKTLGLPAGAVSKGSAGSSDIAVVLGGDYTPPKTGGHE